MTKRRKTAHASLDEVREAAAAERTKQRDLEGELQAAKMAVESAGRAITDLCGRGRQAGRAAAQGAARRGGGHRASTPPRRRRPPRGARSARGRPVPSRTGPRSTRGARVESPHRRGRAEASVLETLRLSRAYLAERQAQDALVASVAGATPRADGPEPQHAWESALMTLERAHQRTPALAPPIPQWRGLERRAAEDDAVRRLQLQRRRKLTVDEQAELDRLNRDLATTR